MRYAVENSGARIVVFDVAGTIALKCPLKISNGDITILGQTAPGDGICLKNYTVSINASNVIIRYMRFRMGDEGLRYYKNGTALTGSDMNIEDDSFNSYHSTGSEVSNIIIDHCSLSWSVDECGSFYGNKNFTMQWCILSESLRNSKHDKGAHGYGGIWGGENASFHHNLIADHDSRNPRFDHGYVSTLTGPVDYIGNVVYNWGGNSSYGGENLSGQEAKKFNMINNYYKPGPYTTSLNKTTNRLLNPTTQCSNCNSSDKTKVVPGKFFISGNVVNGNNATVSTTNIAFDSNYSLSSFQSNCVLSSKAMSTTNSNFSSTNCTTVHTAAKTYEKVAAYAGASLSRDAVDTRVINDMKSGKATYSGSNGSTNGLIDSQSDVGGWPSLTGTKATDTDGDGIPDAWEDANGLNKNSAADALTYTLDPKGYYQNLEVYANSLVESLVKAQRADATETFDEYYPSLASTGGNTGGSTGGSTGGNTDTPASGTLTWDYTSAAPTGSPDNGLTYAANVNDAAGTNNGLKGIKLNSSGYCYFTKSAVAGTLAVTFGPRSGTNAASVSAYSYASTPSAETLIATTETTTALATKTIELSATQNNIYLQRCANTETVITKIVFTPATGSGSGSGGSSSGSTVTGTETTPTVKTSNEDQVGLCYTVPATYVGGQGNSSKAIKFNLRNDKIEINVNPNYTITGFTFTGNDNYSDNGITISSVTVDGGSTNVLGGSKTFSASQAENSFTISGINATQKITLTASAPYDSQLNGTIVFTYKYKVQTLALQSSAKTSSRNGSVTLTFNNPMASGTATLNGQTITADAEGTSLKFVYTGLDFGKTYTFIVSSGVMKDEYNQTYNQPVSITLTTDARATVTKKAFDKIVGSGEELAAAIAAANSRSDKTTRYRIFVKKGAHILPTSGTTTGGDGNTYPDPRTHLSGANVSIIGEDYATTSFTNITPDATWDNGYGAACPLEGIGSGDVLIIDKTATESYFQGVTIRTSMGDAHGRDIAVNDQSNKTIMKDCRLWGYQDTYVSNNSSGRFYFDGGVLRGRTDYLCGKGDVYYNKVTLQQVGTGGYLAVPSVPMKYGYIFNECYIKNETSGVTYYLGRPWGKGTPIALFINTKVDTAPLAAGWDEMSGGWPDRFAEYNTKTTGGSSVSTSSRKTTFNSSYTNKPVLTAAEATYYSNMARIMGGSDGWDPTLYTEQCAKPTATLSGSTLSWTNDSYASSWIVFKDGSYYANPVTNSLSLTEEGTYTVRAANAMGGLGEASAAVEYKDLTNGGATLVFTASVQRSSDATVTKTKDTETHYYNKWGNSTWCAQSYIGFSVNVPEGKMVKSATLKFSGKVNGGNAASYPADVYCLTADQATAFDYETLALGNYMGDNVGSVTDYRANYEEHSVPVSGNIMQARTSTGSTSLVVFLIGGSSGGSYMYGKASASAPTLEVVFEDHVHSYTYTDNGNGTHTKRCTSCGESTTEAHGNICDECGVCHLVDGDEYTNMEEKQYNNLYYTRNIRTANVWYALCVPFSFNVEDYLDKFDVAEIFAFCPYTDTNGDGEVTAEDEDKLIVFKKKTGTTKPNLPYLIRPRTVDTYTINAADGKLYAATPRSVECGTTKKVYTITGVYSSVYATPENNYYYMASDGTICNRTSGSATVWPNRWYMTVTNSNSYESTPVAAKSSYGIVVIGEDVDETTAVRLAKANSMKNDDAIYTLQGVKVVNTRLTPGAYIKNGRKYIIK